MGMPSSWLIRKAKEEVIYKTGLDPGLVELHEFKRDGPDATFLFALYELNGTVAEVRYREQNYINRWHINFVCGLTYEEVSALIEEIK